ncbi:MAG TPA: hypothetical protein PKE00_12965, partial [Planctomycetota bacterium]|nr:hypothetical protein [Planctomycetota bacterium]
MVDGEWWRVCMGAWDKWTERVLGDLNGALLYVSFESKGPSARAWRQNAEVLALESGFKRPSVVRLDLFSTSSEDAVPIELLDEGSEASEYVVVPGHKEGARE